VSAQEQEPLPTPEEGPVQHASHIGFTLLEGGLSQSGPKYSEMPTPTAQPAVPEEEVDKLKYDRPPIMKFTASDHLERAEVFGADQHFGNLDPAAQAFLSRLATQ
jgi:hypothetical protein